MSLAHGRTNALARELRISRVNFNIHRCVIVPVADSLSCCLIKPAISRSKGRIDFFLSPRATTNTLCTGQLDKLKKEYSVATGAVTMEALLCSLPFLLTSIVSTDICIAATCVKRGPTHIWLTSMPRENMKRKSIAVQTLILLGRDLIKKWGTDWEIRVWNAYNCIKENEQMPESLPCSRSIFSLAAAFCKRSAETPTRAGSGCSSKRLARKWRQFQHGRAPSAPCASPPRGGSGSPRTCTCTTGDEKPMC